MDRREFLKLSGLTTLLSISQISVLESLFQPSMEVEYQGKLYRATKDGKIFCSDNGGKLWQLHTDMGKQCSVLQFYSGRDGKLYSQVGLDKHQFKMALTKDGRFWRTVAG